LEIAAEQDDPARLIFSEYHGAAATSSAFMLRDGRCKYIHCVGYDRELYDLDNDPEDVNTQALADQMVLIESHGGVEKVLNRGGLAGTPVPGDPSTIVPVK
jgi:choline-sulfatase